MVCPRDHQADPVVQAVHGTGRVVADHGHRAARVPLRGHHFVDVGSRCHGSDCGQLQATRQCQVLEGHLIRSLAFCNHSTTI